eukprot:ANDGO_05694.mRNA.1 Malate dehydrogenase
MSFAQTHRLRIIASHLNPSSSSSKSNHSALSVSENMSSSPVRIVITGAAGQIAYSLIPLVCSGRVFGPSQPVILHLLDIAPAMTVLSGVVMEIEDCAYPLVAGVVATDNPEVAFKDIDYGLFLGAFPRKDGMERKDLLEKNCGIFKAQGEILNKVAKKTAKIVVVGNPANTNALILSRYAKDIPAENVTALTRLDHNRAKGQIAIRAKANPGDVKNVVIWGNHSSTQYPDVSHGEIAGRGSVNTVLNGETDQTWLHSDFIKCVQQRGAAVIKARQLSSAASAAHAIADHMHDWVLGTKEGEYVSMAVVSKGEYGVEKGLIFSFPVQCANGEWRIVPGLDIDQFSRDMLNKTQAELIEERKQALGE